MKTMADEKSRRNSIEASEKEAFLLGQVFDRWHYPDAWVPRKATCGNCPIWAWKAAWMLAKGRVVEARTSADWERTRGPGVIENRNCQNCTMSYGKQQEAVWALNKKKLQSSIECLRLEIKQLTPDLGHAPDYCIIFIILVPNSHLTPFLSHPLPLPK